MNNTGLKNLNSDNREAVGRNMAPPRFIFDGRNALDPKVMRSAGFECRGVGRNTQV